MIYDAHLRLIFVKTLKVSGSSFEAALIPLLSKRAIATINESWTSGGRRVDAVALRRTTWLPLRRLIPQILRHPREARDIVVDLFRRRGPRHEAFSVEKDHMSAEDVRTMIGRSEWDRCTKVKIARNPYDQLVSYYFMKKKQSAHPESFPIFRDWLAANPEVILKNERLVSVVDDNGVTNSGIDLVLYYEHMEESMEAFAQHFGLDAKVLIERYKSINIHDGFRPKGREGSVAHVVDEESKYLIDTLLKMRFQRLGYAQSTDNIIPMESFRRRQGARTAAQAAS